MHTLNYNSSDYDVLRYLVLTDSEGEYTQMLEDVMLHDWVPPIEVPPMDIQWLMNG